MTTKYLLFNASIDTKTANLLSSAIVDCINADGVDDITIGMCSSGGHVTEGVGLHHVIRSCPKPITIHAFGNIESIAVTVFLGARIRRAVASTHFLFHSVGITLDQRADVRFLTEKLEALKVDELRLGQLWLSHVKLENSELAALFESEQVHDCEWALAHGFVHEICDFFVPPGAPVANVY
jgi:ATP-dependent Clp protease protease subunit